MVTRYAISLILLSAVSFASGQPTLTSGSSTIVPGEQFSYADGEYVQPGPSGASQVWDYSASGLDAPDQISYVSVAATGLAGSYPNATVAIDAGDGNYLFYRGTATTYEEDGFVISGFNAVCSDRLTLVQYPMSIGTSFIDDQICTVTQGASWSRTSSVVVTADGWGNVVTANGTISNVLRLHMVRDVVDNQYTPATTYHTDSYYFYKPGVHSPAVILDHVTTTLFGSVVIADSSLSVLDGSAIGIAEALAQEIGVDVMPNPVVDRLEVIYGIGGGMDLSIALLDLTGRTLQSVQRRSQLAGVQREFLEMGELPAGVYLVRITDETGAMGVKRVVKN